MTGGWAATNTLREAADYYGHHVTCASVMFGEECDCGNYRIKAALALVEAALDAAADLEGRIVSGPDWNLGEVFNAGGRLAAALRAVREGK